MRGSAKYIMGLSGTVWPLHMGAGQYGNYLYLRKFQRKLFLSRDKTDGAGSDILLKCKFSIGGNPLEFVESFAHLGHNK